MELPNNCIAQIKAKIKSSLPSWRQYGDYQIHLQRMNGITNQTYKAWIDQQMITPIFIRKLSPSQENIFLSREFEMLNYECIQKAGIAPKVYYFDNFFRIEQFIQSEILPNRQTIGNRKLRQIAFHIRRFHDLSPEHLNSKKNISMFQSKIITNQNYIIKKASEILSFQPSSPLQKQLIQKYSVLFSNRQFQFLLELIKNHSNQLVFSHNDLIRYNMLVETQTDRLILIDYEYSYYNFQIYDLAYYLNESAFDYDLNEFPYFTYHEKSKQAQKEQEKQFICAYVSAQSCSFEQHQAKFDEVMNNPDKIGEIQQLISLLPFGKLLVNFVWANWRLLEGRFPKFNIDFTSFLNIRHELYSKYKKQLGY